MENVIIEPSVALAFGLRSSPGAYALLLGAGVSMSAGVPSAWGVQEQLLRQLARAEGETPADPFAWYRDRYGERSTYDGLLDALTCTKVERQALLRGFFEPSEEEREQDLKIPTPAHRAVARLVAAGLVCVILTINFDRLTEAALRAEGIEPVVASVPAHIRGLAPLHTIRCLVVHLHGDYLNPTGMLNTSEELAGYPRVLDRFLDQVFDQYGLVIAGWSAAWDTALRTALSRCPTRRFATYWIDPHPLGELAKDLRVRQQATHAQATADAFFGQLADTCQALADVDRPHPASVQAAVATAKRALSGARIAITLHDLIREQAEHVRTLAPVTTTNFEAADPTEHGRRLAQLEADSQLLLALVATTVYWGNETTDGWWFDDIHRFAAPSSSGGLPALVQLTRAPATLLLYAAGVAATAAGRWPLVGRLLTEPRTLDPRSGQQRRVAEILGPAETLNVASRWLYDRLSPVFVEQLSLGGAAYTDAWERFEYLRLVAHTDHRLRTTGGRSSDTPHIRADGSANNQPVVADWLAQRLDRQGQEHPVLRAGVCDGDLPRLREAMAAYNDDFRNFANHYAISKLGGDPGFRADFLPSGLWYPDESL